MEAHPDDPTSKMAVLLHADVAGSTVMVQRDERIAHRRITEAIKRLSEAVHSYGGTTHEIRGDALVAEFGRASDAVCAALAFQQANEQAIRDIDDDIVPRMRIGIALGEVVFADATVTGAGVVLAQRIEQLADGGGVCITGAIREALPKRLPIETEDLGENSLKGFDDYVRVYKAALRADAEVPPPAAVPGAARKSSLRPAALVVAALVVVAAAATGAYVFLRPGEIDERVEQVESRQTSDRPSIAVLPFANMSGEPEQEYFADGITEDLTTDLSKISGLFVVSRNSAFAYKNQSPDVREVSRALGVRYVLEGSVRRSGSQVRINAQLIDGETGGHVWAERFDGSMTDIFSLQDDVNERIVDALQVSLTLEEKRQITDVETTNPDAYDALLKGLEQYQLFSPEANRAAIRHFKRAIELDPDYARAYANVGLTYAQQVNFLWTDDRDEAIREGLVYAARALELDDTIPQTFLTRSALFLAQRKHDEAVAAARKVVELHPGYADGHVWLAFILIYDGHPREALESLERGKVLNPQSSYIYMSLEGRILFFLGRYEEAREVLEQSIQRNPAMDRSQLTLAAVQAELGNLDDASWALEEAQLLNPNISLRSERESSIYRRPEDLERYLDALRKAGLSDE